MNILSKNAFVKNRLQNVEIDICGGICYINQDDLIAWYVLIADRYRLIYNSLLSENEISLIYNWIISQFGYTEMSLCAVFISGGFMNNDSSATLILWAWWLVTLCIFINIVSGNGLSPAQRKAFTWTNVDVLPIEPLGINFSDTWIKIFQSRKWTWKCRLQHDYTKIYRICCISV